MEALPPSQKASPILFTWGHFNIPSQSDIIGKNTDMKKHIPLLFCPGAGDVLASAIDDNPFARRQTGYGEMFGVAP